MGERGAVGKPTALRVLHGDRSSRINLNEPQPRNMGVARPEWLSPEAGELWDALAPDLDVMGTTKVTDSVALAALCETYGRWRKVNALAAKTPPVYRRHRDGEDIFVKNPLYSQIRDLTNELRIMLREFGLTPSARAGLRVDLTISNGVDRLFTTG